MYDVSSESEPDESTPIIQAATLVAKAEKQVQTDFVWKVYTIFALQLLTTIVISLPFQHYGREALLPHIWIYWASFAVLLTTFLANWCMADSLKKFPENYIFLAVLTVVMGVTLGYTCALYSWHSVIVAAAVVLADFICMSLYAYLAKPDFEDAGPHLMATLLTLVFCALSCLILSWFGIYPARLQILETAICVLLFCFFIVYDTQRIVTGDHVVQFSVDDYAFAAVSLYLDIVNLFLALLMVLGTRDGKLAKHVMC